MSCWNCVWALEDAASVLYETAYMAEAEAKAPPTHEGPPRFGEPMPLPPVYTLAEVLPLAEQLVSFAGRLRGRLAGPEPDRYATPAAEDPAEDPAE